MPETALDELRTALTRATRATRTPSSTRPVVPREVAAFLMRKNSGRMWPKSLILLHFVSCGAVKTQKFSGIGFARNFDKTSNPCCAQFQAIAQQATKGHGCLLRTTEKTN